MKPPRDESEVIRISLSAYLRTMWAVFWSALRHPIQTTVIDATTGRVLYRKP